MQLTPVQRRTLEDLIGLGERPAFPPDLGERLRRGLDRAVAALDLPTPLWLSKDRLNAHARCEGLFQAGLLGEHPPFEHTLRTAAGTLLHKAIEVEVGGRVGLDPADLAERAADRLRDDRAFGPFWDSLGEGERDELVMETARAVLLFRETFPPLRLLRSELAPVTELRLRAELAGGALVLSGRVDLVLGRPDPAHPDRASRLVLDLKSGAAWPEYPEDMRFYALLATLRFGVPPYRAATVFLESGGWQAEDVTEEVLDHAAERVVSAARAAAALVGGRSPTLSAGPHCSWCPRGGTCPESAVRTASARAWPGGRPG